MDTVDSYIPVPTLARSDSALPPHSLQALPAAAHPVSPRPAPSLQRPLASLGIAQRFFSTTAIGGVVAAAGPVGNSGASAGDRTLTVFVKREGDPSWAEVVLTNNATVARLTKAIVAELPSLQGKDASTLTLHVARDKAGTDLGDALESSDMLAAVNLQAGTKIVVKVAGAAGAAAPGEQSASPRHAPVHLRQSFRSSHWTVSVWVPCCNATVSS